MLNISDNSISNEGLKAITSGFDLAPSKEIVSLNLSHNDLEGVTAIENLGSLLDNSSSIVSLNLSENKIGDDGVELLSKYFNEGKSRLSKLYLSSIGATVNGLKTLFNALRLNQHLTYLCLDGNSLKTPSRITREQLLKAQNYYNYEIPQYSNPALDKLSIFLWNNKKLEVLEMRGC